MNLLKVKRKTETQTRFTKQMGALSCQVTSIWITLLGLIPLKRLHVYRDTYYGEVKDLEDCNLNK